MARSQAFDTTEALHQALQVFWKKGYEAASLPNLLEATGLSRSSFYGTFGNKRELFLRAFDSYRAERVREMNAILGNGNGRVAVEAFFRKIISDAHKPNFTHGCMSINQGVEMAPHDPEVRARVEADLQLIEDTIAQTIARGQADGSIRSDRDARRVARLLVVAFPGFQVIIRAGTDKARLDDALDLMLAFLDIDRGVADAIKSPILD